MTAEGRPWFQRLRESLTRTRDQLAISLEALAGRAIDDAYLAELEEALILADVGAATAAEVTSRLRAGGGPRRRSFWPSASTAAGRRRRSPNWRTGCAVKAARCCLPRPIPSAPRRSINWRSGRSGSG